MFDPTPSAAVAPAPAADQSQTTTPAPASGQPAPNTTLLGNQTNPQPGDGQKPADQKPANQAPVVPEKYDLKLPDGSVFDAAHLEEVSAYAKELKLSTEQAQKLVERDNALVSGYREREQANWQKMVNDWSEKVKADPEIGGDKLDTNVQAARKALDRFGSPALKEMLNKTGAGNHPELVRIFAKIGQALADDKILNGSNGGKQPRDPAEVLYGKPSA
jgi:hypothetical protein